MSRDALTKARKKAARTRATTGDLEEYFKKMSRLRAREAELPVVTFWVLDQFRRILEVQGASQRHYNFGRVSRCAAGVVRVAR